MLLSKIKLFKSSKSKTNHQTTKQNMETILKVESRINMDILGL